MDFSIAASTTILITAMSTTMGTYGLAATRALRLGTPNTTYTTTVGIITPADVAIPAHVGAVAGSMTVAAVMMSNT